MLDKIYNKYISDFKNVKNNYLKEINCCSYDDLMNGINYIEEVLLSKFSKTDKVLFSFNKLAFNLSMMKINQKFMFISEIISDNYTYEYFRNEDPENDGYICCDDYLYINILLSKDLYFYSSEYLKYENNKYKWKENFSELKEIDKDLKQKKYHILKVFHFYLPEILSVFKS